jgi:hypothetical protein
MASQNKLWPLQNGRGREASKMRTTTCFNFPNPPLAELQSSSKVKRINHSELGHESRKSENNHT